MTLYKTNVDKFSNRIFKQLYTHIILPGLLLLLPLLSFNGDKLISSIWVAIMLLIIIMRLISSYNWTLKQVVLLSFHDDFFEVVIMSKNIKYLYSVHKANIKSTLKWQGSRPRILRLSLFDNELKLADFYSGGKQKLEYALEEIDFKINKYKNNSC